MTVQYTFADLESLSQVIRKAHSEVDTLKSDIRSASGSLQSDWTGSASESWGAVQTKWDGACQSLLTALHQLAQTVLQNSSAMSQTEATNAKLFQGL
jgi:WXG100 family type VII secretion target